MSLLLSDFYPKADAVLITGNQTITGLKNFLNRPTVGGVGVLLQGEASPGGGGTIENAVYTTGNQTITGPKNFTARPTLSGLNLITTGDLVNLELNITGDILGSTIFDGNREIKRETWPSFEEVGGDNVVEFLNNVFFPYRSTNLTLNDFQIRVYGTESINSTVFAGTIFREDDQVTGIAYRSGAAILSGPNPRADTSGPYTTSPQLIPLNTTLSASTNIVYSTLLYVVTPQGVPQLRASASKRIRFEPRYYYGVSANPNLGVNVTGLTPSNPANYTYNFNSKPGSVTHAGFSPVGQYIYFAYPSPSTTQDGIINWGNSLTSIFDINTNFEYISSYSNLGTVTVTFPFKSLNYRIYRSNNLLTLNPGQNFNLRFTFGA